MLSNTTAPAEELQDKLAALEQLLLAYGRVAIGFSGGVDSSFLAAVCARIMPDSTLLVHLTTPLIGTPEQASFERSVTGKPMRSRILSSLCSIFRSISCSSPK